MYWPALLDYGSAPACPTLA